MKYEPENLKRWTLPRDYAGAEWPDYYVFLSQHRDSDCLTRSNFRSGWASLQAVPTDNENEPVIVRENHWAVGWVEWIAIHQSDTDNLKLADAMAGKIESYPVLDENDYSELENEEANEVWKNCYDASERIEYIREHKSQFEFHNLADMLGCVRGNYFAGYASELIQ